jgi:hypothetical protein
VHSSGFHICFDLAAEPTLGYILPTWLEQQERDAAGESKTQQWLLWHNRPTAASALGFFCFHHFSCTSQPLLTVITSLVTI